MFGELFQSFLYVLCKNFKNVKSCKLLDLNLNAEIVV